MVGIYFREVPVTPTLLLAGKTYVIGALYDASNTDLTVYDPNATVTYSPLITAGYYQVAANAPNTLACPVSSASTGAATARTSHSKLGLPPPGLRR